MTRPVHLTSFWAERLKRVGIDKPYRYRAVYDCSLELWGRINRAHQQILQSHVLPDDRILDVGCGWGRLLGLLPLDWAGLYTGVDLSPEFVALAKVEHPEHTFVCSRIEEFVHPGRFDLAVLVSVRGMILREQGETQWELMRANIAAMASRILYLEYDPADPGVLEALTLPG